MCIVNVYMRAVCGLGNCGSQYYCYLFMYTCVYEIASEVNT